MYQRTIDTGRALFASVKTPRRCAARQHSQNRPLIDLPDLPISKEGKNQRMYFSVHVVLSDE
jgi:hypothetical protein